MKHLLLIFFIFLFSAIPAFNQTCDNCIPGIPNAFPTNRSRLNCALTRISSSAPTSIDNLLSTSIILEDEKKYAEANVQITEAIKLEPNLAILYLLRARNSVWLKNIADVLQDTQTGISLKPDADGEIFERIIAELHWHGYANESLKVIEMMIASDELKHLGYYYRALENKNHVGAFEDALKSLELYPYDEMPRLGYVISKADYLSKDSIDYGLRVLDKIEKRFAYYSKNKFYKKVIRNCKEEIYSDDSLTYGLYSDALSNVMLCINYHEKQGQTEKVLETIKRIARFEPKERAYMTRRNIYFNKGFYKEAIEDATFLIDLTKGMPISQKHHLYFRAVLYSKSKQYEKAIKDLETLILLNILDKEEESNALRFIEEIKKMMLEDGNK